MKKILGFTMVLAALAISSCGNGKGSASKTDSSSAKKDSTKVDSTKKDTTKK